MYLFGNSYFETLSLKNAFQAVFIVLLAAEMLLYLLTEWYGRRGTGVREKSDKGSCLLIVAGFAASIAINPVCRKLFPTVLPVWLFWIGAILILAGVILRVYSVWTLGRFFTFSVQVNSEQEIIRTGPYKYLRHPAYSGSILSLAGVALAFRSPAGFLGTLIIVMLVYGYRIRVEEKVLERSFGAAYREYAGSTSRIIPFVW